MNEYTVRARPVGKYWHVEVTGVGVTQARHVREIKEMAADLIAVIADDTDPSLTVELDLPAEVAAHQARANELRAAEAEARAEAAAEVRAAAWVLRRDGMPLRDVGAALGVSHQRAAQLLEEA